MEKKVLSFYPILFPNEQNENHNYHIVILDGERGVAPKAKNFPLNLIQ